jgi:hypothetical protein
MSVNLTFSMHHKACHLDWLNILIMLCLQIKRKGTEDKKKKELRMEKIITPLYGMCQYASQ